MIETPEWMRETVAKLRFEGPGPRRSGRTFRATLRALLAASETPKQRVVIVVPGRDRARLHNLPILQRYAETLQGTTRLPSGDGVRLVNGSEVRVVAWEVLERDRWTDRLLQEYAIAIRDGA